MPGVSRADAPTAIGTATDWVAISLGAFHACGLRGNGVLWCWGRNEEGQLGLGRFDPIVASPAQVAGRWTAVSAGRFHTCAIDADGAAWCTGDNSDGQLGDATTERRSAFVRVVSP